MKVKRKNWLIGLIAAVIVCLVIVGIVVAVRVSTASAVTVIPVDSIAYSSFDEYSNTSDGTIRTQVSQRVNLDADSILSEVCVSEGEQVKVGDPLLTYDTTLDEMELSIAQLTRQLNEQKLAKAQERLNALQNGGKIEDSDFDMDDGYDSDIDSDLDSDEDEDSDDTARLDAADRSGVIPAAFIRPVSQTEETTIYYYDTLEYDSVPYQGDGSDKDPYCYLCDVNQEQIILKGSFLNKMAGYDAQGEQIESDPSYYQLVFYEDNQVTNTIQGSLLRYGEAQPYDPDAEERINVNRVLHATAVDPANLPLYDTLDDQSEPFMGDGTADNPYCYLCDSSVEEIILMGSFLNQMAGYDAQGTEQVADAPFYYLLVFFEGKDITNPDALQGGLLRKGGSDLYEADQEVKSIKVDKVLTGWDITPTPTPTPTTTETPTPSPDESPEPDYPDGDSDSDSDDWYDSDSDWPDDSDSGEPDSDSDDDDDEQLSREDAIKSQQANIETLEMTIKSNDMNISELEDKIDNQTVKAKIDGTVTTVGDPDTGESDGSAFIVVRSDEGIYVQGAISEMKLDQVETGQLIHVQSYEDGETYEAEIREISQFPTDDEEDDSDYAYFDTNSNVSYYPFTAELLDDEAPLTDGDYVSITIPGISDSDTVVSVEAAFIREEDGVCYVYKDQDGKLVKQVVNATKASDGYSYEVTSGISKNDMLAFPYGKGVKEGAKTKEGTISELWGY